jgi:hypothetical protein
LAVFVLLDAVGDVAALLISVLLLFGDVMFVGASNRIVSCALAPAHLQHKYCGAVACQALRRSSWPTEVYHRWSCL